MSNTNTALAKRRKTANALAMEAHTNLKEVNDGTNMAHADRQFEDSSRAVFFVWDCCLLSVIGHDSKQGIHG